MARLIGTGVYSMYYVQKNGSWFMGRRIMIITRQAILIYCNIRNMDTVNFNMILNLIKIFSGK